MNIEREFEKVEEKVRYVMKNYEQARNDDYFLYWFIWRHIEEKDLNRLGELREATNPETIRRNRAKIQNVDNDFPPTDPEVVEKRKEKEQKVSQYFSQFSNPHKSYQRYKEKKEDE